MIAAPGDGGQRSAGQPDPAVLAGGRPAQPAGPAAPVVVREATAADAAGILGLIRELAEYEREPESVAADEESVAAALSGPDPVAHALVATAGGGDIVGMALWFRTFSTWTGRPGMWLEDLYVRPEHRRSGLGRQLLQRLAAHCVTAGWSRLEWTVLDWNAPAHAFYASVGAVPNSGWTTNRVTGTALTELAAAAPPPD